jgi:3-hydroxyisobutyrate dehydrogenase
MVKPMNVAVIGLGLMGIPVALRLAERDYHVVAWNRGEEKRKKAEDQGVDVISSLARVIDESDCLLLTLSDYSAIIDTLLSQDISRLLSGKTVVQMGTIAPEESRSLERRLAEHGVRYLEAPVLGSIPEARAGTLIIMAGGADDLFQQVLPLLTSLGPEPALVGGVGQGAALKLAMNQLIASLTTGFSLSLGLVRSEGLDVERFMELLRTSALYAPTFDKKLGKMLDHDYANPNFPLKHLLKDVALFNRVAGQVGIDSRTTAAIEGMLTEGVDELGEEDYSALYELVNKRT